MSASGADLRGAPPAAGLLPRPGAAAYAGATAVFNLAAPLAPAAAVRAHSVGEVRDAVRRAAAEGLDVRVHTTGHSSATQAPMAGALLVRTQLTGGVVVDPRRRTARLPAGTCWGEVVDAVAPHGLAAPHGSAATVGVVGYLLRGGLSYYGRHTGLAVNCVRAIELVTADGEFRRTDAGCDPELFWALRGGGGGFGVVTAVEIDLIPVAEVVTGAAFWPVEHAEQLLGAWLRWTAEAPAEISTSAQVLNFPDLPDVPPSLSAGPVLCIAGAAVAAAASDADGCRGLVDELLGPLRAVAQPMIDTWRPGGPAAVLEAHMDPPDPVPLVGDHLLLSDLDDAAITELVRLNGDGSGTPLVGAGLRQLGGGFATPHPTGGALSHLEARFAYSGAGVPGLTGSRIEIVEHCGETRRVLAPWDTGRTVPSFVESHQQPQCHLDPARIEAVDRVRSRADPAGLFAGDVAPGATGHRPRWSPSDATTDVSEEPT